MFWLIALASIQFCAVIAMLILRLWPSDTEEVRKPTRKQPYYGAPTLKPDWTKKAEHIEHIQPAKNVPQQPSILFTTYLPQQRELVVSSPVLQPTASQIKSLASQLAAEAEMELDGTRIIYRMVMENGGVCRYAKDREKEEYENSVPLHYRRHNGLPPDRMASTLGFTSDSELYEQIQKSERLRRSLTASLPYGKFRAKDFLEDAEWELTEMLNEEAFKTDPSEVYHPPL